MKKWICIIAMTVLVLAGFALWQGLHREDAAPGDSGAALGLMLLENEPDRGLYVLAVTQDSPADRAGIHPGDYLLQADGAPLHTAAQLDALLDAAPAVLPLTLGRDGRQLEVALPTR